MKVTSEDLHRWARETVKQAIQLGYDERVLSELLQRVHFRVIPGYVKNGLWYGWAEYSKKQPLIAVYEKNMTTEGVSCVRTELEKKNVPAKLIRQLLSVYRVLPQQVWFELVGQSGMDHELIGHVYNFLIGASHDEQAACEAQIILAKKRGGLFKIHWKLIAALAPTILAYHKKDEFIPK